MLPVPLDRHGGVTLQEQIYRYIRSRITDGTLAAGAKLPSTRDLAAALGVSRNTAVLAYDWLVAEGYVLSRGGAGSFVAHLAEPPPMEPAAVPAVTPQPTAAAPRLAYDFWYGRSDRRLFPARVWRALALEALGACAHGLTEYGETGGDPVLRRAIAAHLAVTRGIRAGVEQIIVTTGAQEALNLAARLLVTPGTAVAVEDPGYDAAARVFETHGATVHPAPIDGDGLDPAGLGGIRPRLVYVTPSHQFPTGAVMSLERRHALLAQCARHGGIIIEDDYDGEIVFHHPPIAALAAIDRLERTVYIGSFSKAIGSGLRLGYVVVPATLAAAAQAVKGLMSYGQSWLDQQILAAFLDSGRYERHLRRLRVAYRARRDATAAALRAHFGPGLSISGSGAGLHLYATLPLDGPDAETVAARARAVGVGLYPAAVAGARAVTVDASRSLVVGFAALTPGEIAKGFARLEPAGWPAPA